MFGCFACFVCLLTWVCVGCFQYCCFCLGIIVRGSKCIFLFYSEYLFPVVIVKVVCIFPLFRSDVCLCSYLCLYFYVRVILRPFPSSPLHLFSCVSYLLLTPSVSTCVCVLLPLSLALSVCPCLRPRRSLLVLLSRSQVFNYFSSCQLVFPFRVYFRPLITA